MQTRHSSPDAVESWTVGDSDSPWPVTAPEQFRPAMARWDVSIVFGISAPQGGVHVPNRGITDKLLFGSDYPLWTPEGAGKGLRTLNERAGHPTSRWIDDAFVDRLLERDALGLLGLDR